MANIGMLIGGALANALAFSGSGFLFQHLSKHSVDEEQRRHDEAVENLEKAQMTWQRKRQDAIDLIKEQLLKEKKAEQKLSELDDAMSEYSRVFKTQLPSLPPRPVFSDYYRPSDEQHGTTFVLWSENNLASPIISWRRAVENLTAKNPRKRNICLSKTKLFFLNSTCITSISIFNYLKLTCE